ncbi:hypothetical protein C8Q77DRAFT_1120463 [Trametes polyzona]|nr:hypothetical protein C8Q77DRAFT_1120463 [Trametes polyzona]
MLRSLFRARLPQRPALALRRYSLDTPSHAHPTPSADFLLDAYRKHCQNPALDLVVTLEKPAGRYSFNNLLRSASVSHAEYDQWQPVTTAPTMAVALDRAQAILAAKQGASHHSDSANGSGIFPTWALLSLLCKPPLSETEAFVAHRLAVSHPLTPSPDLGILALILAAFWLTRLKMHAPLQTILFHLARYHKHLHPYQVALVLRMIAGAEPIPELQRVISAFLHIAIRRKMYLSSGVYRALLDNPATSGPTAFMIERHMKRIGYTPNLSHSRAFVRIYGDSGRRKQAARHWRRIRHGEFFGQVPEYINSDDFQAHTVEDYLKAFKDPVQATSYVHYMAKNAAKAREALPDESLDLPLKPALRKPDDVPPNVWLRVLLVAARDPKTPTARLLTLLEEGRRVLHNSSKTLLATTIVIKSLLRRGEFEEILPLLSFALRQKHMLDTAQLSIVVEALTVLNRPDAAYRLIRELAQPHTDVSAGPPTSEGSSSSKDPQVDTQLVNTFMIALLRIGRPDAVFYLWDTLPRVFPGVEPSATTLAILLKSARFARKCEGALQVALQDFGLRRLLSRRGGDATTQTLDRAQALEGLERLLRRDERRVVNGFWRGERAGAVALRLVWRIMVGNWPLLASLRPPVRAIRRNADEQALSPVADLFHSVGGGQGDGGSQGEDDGEVLFPVDENGRTYFGIVPHDVMFRALLDLLAEEDQAGQVPLVLAWMKHLRVRPSKDTLATALVYWGEVSLEGPLIERWKGPGRSEYERLVEWIGKWVGKKGVPEREEMQRALRRVQYFRDMRTIGVRKVEGVDELIDV